MVSQVLGKNGVKKTSCSQNVILSKVKIKAMDTVASPEVAKVEPFLVLVVDEEKTTPTTQSACLEAMGCRVTALSTASRALAALGRQPFDLAFGFAP